MIKKTAFIANLIACLVGFSLANAADFCVKISGDAGQLKLVENPIDCTNIEKELAASKKFPGIFSDPKDPKLLHICYVSSSDQGRRGLPVTVNNAINMEIMSKSAWTTDFNPFYGDTLVTIITEMAFWDPVKERVIGKTYAIETLNPVSAQEFSVIIGGSEKLSGAKGSISISSTPGPITSDTSLPEYIEINKISGIICLPQLANHNN